MAVWTLDTQLDKHRMVKQGELAGMETCQTAAYNEQCDVQTRPNFFISKV